MHDCGDPLLRSRAVDNQDKPVLEIRKECAQGSVAATGRW